MRAKGCSRVLISLFMFLGLLTLSPLASWAGVEPNTDRPGQNYANFNLPQADPYLCQKACAQDKRCVASTYVKPGIQGPQARCWLKRGVPPAKPNPCCTTWVKDSGKKTAVRPTAKVVQAKPAQRMPADQKEVKAKKVLAAKKLPSSPGAAMAPHKPGSLEVRQIKFSTRQGWEFAGPNLQKLTLGAPNPDLCQDVCARDKKCWGFTYVKPGPKNPQALCYLKSKVAKARKAGCCTSGSKVPPAYLKIDPNSAQAKKTAAQARQYKNNLREFMAKAHTHLPAKVAQTNRRIQVLERRRWLDQRARLKSYFQKGSQAAKIPAASFDQARLRAQVVSMAKTPVAKTAGSQLQINQAIIKGAGLQPAVTGILTAPVSPVPNYVHEGGYVILFGRNFGNQPGKVMLTYRREQKEFGKTAPPKAAVTLEPWKGSWHQAWQDTMVIAKIPILPPGYTLTEANLTLWRDGQRPLKLLVPVRFWRKGPGVHSIQASPEWGDHQNRDAAVFGGELMLTGEGFGDKPGRVYLELTQPLGGKHRIDLLPGLGTWAQSWKERFLYLKVPDLKMNAPTQTALLVIEPSYNRKALYKRGISFGPRLVYAVVNGKQFLDLDTSAPDNWLETNGPYLRVAHGPDCTWYRWFGSDGTDRFFKNKKLPANTRVLRHMITQVDPKLPWTTWDIVLSELGDLVNAFTGGPISLLEWFGSSLAMAMGSAFDRHIGWYKAEVREKPSRKNPATSVRWFTTCHSMSPAQDLPIVYITTFLVEGPAGYCPGEIIDLKDSVI